jgi:DNA-binding CsgD family transcriptional regulator
MLSRSDTGVELLYQYQDFNENFVPWNTDSLAALPAQARSIVTQMGSALARGEKVLPVLNSTGGRSPVVSVRIAQYEALDLSLARVLLDKPFSLQEKRILVASTRRPSLQDLATHLGITVGTLKIYINRLQAKAGLPSRQEIIDQLLTDATQAPV